jgi:hypothetical protein
MRATHPLVEGKVGLPHLSRMQHGDPDFPYHDHVKVAYGG